MRTSESAHRLVKGLMQLGRFPEVLSCRSATKQWPTLTAAYAGWPIRLPFSVNLSSGSFEFHERSDVATFWQIFFRQVYPVCPDARLIIDAGANIGAFTLFALLRAPDCHVIAIEPAPDSCQRLRSLVRRHGFEHRCTIHQAALSDRMGTTTIQMNVGSQFRVSGKGGVEVSSITLSHLVGAHDIVDMLKIDTEGAEYQTFPAVASETLRRIRQIELEYHPSGNPQMLFRRLTGCGFTVNAVRDQGGGYGTASLSAHVP